MTFARFRPVDGRPSLSRFSSFSHEEPPRAEAPQAPLGLDGCESHAVTADDVALRWRHVEAIIAATPEDDHSAQWSVVSMCPCCCAPAKVDALVCSRCAGADLDQLRQAPPCACGRPGVTIHAGQWVCRSHFEEGTR